ncbi:hypothetical protein J4G43_027975 [Bradyrhizobium barranii subsp. barranii]|uniref:Carbohydrate binding protein n=1 Tax=Bradyrhizobium barranii subsp. barranii TaxID=2823807 RepID=A0A9X9XLQ5_9BRAD|nr:hypothetical protein [Bradyrhizobium barranii]UEM08599.1 hypothetical protein J4G43_027975 [Bradyrhizobium barranii subsp. barranii]
MTALVSYSTGTVSVAAGGTIVTGVGTIWSGTNARPGDVLQIGNFQSVISDVTDLTHLVVLPWGGGAQAGVAYKIWQVSPQRFAGSDSLATVNKLVAAFNTSGFFVFVDVALTAPDPSLGDDGQYAFQPTTGKTWAKVAGVWTYLGIYKGFNFRGVYDNAATYSYGDVQTTSGSSYVYINATPSAGHAAPNVTYWQLLASIGPTGGPGPTGAGYGGTSTTSLAIGTGSKAFTTQAGLAYTNGARVRASSAANTSNWMEGLATYSGTTLTINIDKTNGSGTLADWNFNVAGQPGDVTGPASSTSGNIATFSGTTGKVVQDGGVAISTDGTFAANSDARVPTEKAVKAYVDTAGGAWTVTNPTVTASSGAFTTVSCQLRYKLIGKTAVFTATVTMTNAGTASGNILFNLPFTPIVAHAGGGKEILSLGHQCNWQTSSSQMIIAKYDNTSVIASGRGVVITGTIEVV